MSESFLSQEEVDALLEGVTGESQKTVEAAAEHGEVRAYNISSQERIVRGRMPTMEIVNERFARNLRVGLFNFIRRSPGDFGRPGGRCSATARSCVNWRCRPTSISWRSGPCGVVVWWFASRHWFSVSLTPRNRWHRKVPDAH